MFRVRVMYVFLVRIPKSCLWILQRFLIVCHSPAQLWNDRWNDDHLYSSVCDIHNLLRRVQACNQSTMFNGSCRWSSPLATVRSCDRVEDTHDRSLPALAYHLIIPSYKSCSANLISLAVRSMNSAACHRSSSMCING